MRKVCLIVLIITFLWTDENQADSRFDVSRLKLAYHSCSALMKESVLTDGIKDPSAYEVMSTDCEVPELVRFNVKIPSLKNIGSVTVYSGKCDDCDGLLNNFLIKLFSESDQRNMKSCGQYDREFLGPGNPMKVNCDVSSNYDETMFLIGIYPNDYQKKVSQKSTVSEISIRLLEYSKTAAFYGCYKEFEGHVYPTKGDCKITCAHLGYRFMALSFDDECKCGNKLPKNMIIIKKCLNACPEPNLVCAMKGDGYAVYIALPPHIYSLGCYAVPSSGFSFHLDNMTSISCIQMCSKKNYAYSYVSLETCYCTTVVTEDKQHAHLCNTTCPGDDSRCGGKGVVSVYGGCLDNPDQSPCTAVYKCENYNFNQYGKCLGPCKTKWIGQYCLSREVPQPPRVGQRPPLSFNPTPGTRTGLSIECRQAIKAFLNQRSTQSLRGTKCLKAIQAEHEMSISRKNFKIIIMFATIVACASGVASGVWYGRSHSVNQVEG